MTHDCGTWTDTTRHSVVGEGAMRLVLARLEDDSASTAVVLMQFDECPRCLKDMVEYFVGAFSHVVQVGNGRDQAIEITKRNIDRERQRRGE